MFTGSYWGTESEHENCYGTFKKLVRNLSTGLKFYFLVRKILVFHKALAQMCIVEVLSPRIASVVQMLNVSKVKSAKQKRDTSETQLSSLKHPFLQLNESIIYDLLLLPTNHKYY